MDTWYFAVSHQPLQTKQVTYASAKATGSNLTRRGWMRILGANANLGERQGGSMSSQIRRSIVFTALAALALFTVPVQGQTPATAAKLASSATGKKWTARTPDGQPDLQGIWTNATITPFERPKELGMKQFLTKEEAAALERRAADNNVDRAPRDGDVGAYNQAWLDGGSKVVPTLQTSLVVDPPDGRVPVTPAAEAKRAYAQ